MFLVVSLKSVHSLEEGIMKILLGVVGFPFFLIYRLIFRKSIQERREVYERLIISLLREKALCFAEILTTAGRQSPTKQLDRKTSNLVIEAMGILRAEGVVTAELSPLSEYTCGMEDCVCAWREFEMRPLYRLTGKPRKRRSPLLRETAAWKSGLLGQPA
jgi:hypothetical protein